MKWQWDEELCLTNRCVRNYSVLFGPQAHNGQMRSLCVRLSLSHTSSLEESQLSHFLLLKKKKTCMREEKHEMCGEGRDMVEIN